mmetsp:Transcript_59608/g.191816  ORF Transcript_59608/g.191816 Transcript_59608/m.191816 type:complete len:238 (-) Transcript_59608:639-1352(-)
MMWPESAGKALCSTPLLDPKAPGAGATAERGGSWKTLDWERAASSARMASTSPPKPSCRSHCRISRRPAGKLLAAAGTMASPVASDVLARLSIVPGCCILTACSLPHDPCGTASAGPRSTETSGNSAPSGPSSLAPSSGETAWLSACSASENRGISMPSHPMLSQKPVGQAGVPSLADPNCCWAHHFNGSFIPLALKERRLLLDCFLFSRMSNNCDSAIVPTTSTLSHTFFISAMRL